MNPLPSETETIDTAPLHARGIDSYFQTLRTIEILSRDDPRIGKATSPQRESHRISQPAATDFAAATVESIEADRQGRWNVSQRSFGLLGPSGPLPTHLTELVRNRTRHAHDPALQDFLDLFHHRMASLFYRAWRSSRPAVERDRPEDDRFADYVGSLVGCGSQAAQNRDRLPDDVKRFASGHLSSQTRHAEGLERFVTIVFGLPCHVRSFALQWLDLDASCRSRLPSRGQKSVVQSKSAVQSVSAESSPPRLGQGAVLGKRVADRQSMIDLVIGPMDFERFQSFLPKQPGRETLTAMLDNYVGPAIDTRVRLRLSQSAVPSLQLGKQGQLGRTAWLASKPSATDRDDCTFVYRGKTCATGVGGEV
jgi:type VI secretion system protein ImpH